MPPPFSRKRFHAGWWLIGIAVVIAVRLALEYAQQPAEDRLSEGRYQIARVIDGDTLLTRTGVRVRLQGIDTPETVRPDSPVEAWGPEAKAFAEQFVQDAHGEVELTFGPERLDRYRRYLAFVWHGDVMLNEELLRAGLARARLGYRYSGTMKRRFANAEQEARDNQRGIWATAKSADGRDDSSTVRQGPR